MKPDGPTMNIEEMGIDVRFSGRAVREIREQEAIHKKHKKRNESCYWCISEAFGVRQ